ncbi:MAG: EamA family transporter [Candidatus Aenigmarchaeota archaeon]|nr:EamA family transporter [Candidatus Aenigmarchaeota archaeon]
MAWLEYALAAAVVLSAVHLLEKHVLIDELKDPVFATTVAGFSTFLLLALLAAFANPFLLPPWIALLAFAAGVAYNLSAIPYFTAEEGEEVSRVTPMLNLQAVFIALFAAAFLGESLATSAYVGMFLVVGGAMLITMKHRPALRLPRPFRRRVSVHSLATLVLASTLLLAVRNLLLDAATASSPLFAVLAWVGLGGLSVGAILLAFHHPRIRGTNKKGIEHFLAASVLAFLFFLLASRAIAEGPVSLVSAVLSTSIFFVFLGAVLLSRTHSHIVREELRGSSIAIKLAAMLLIFIGLWLVVR